MNPAQFKFLIIIKILLYYIIHVLYFILVITQTKYENDILALIIKRYCADAKNDCYPEIFMV